MSYVSTEFDRMAFSGSRLLKWTFYMEVKSILVFTMSGSYRRRHFIFVADGLTQEEELRLYPMGVTDQFL